LLRGTTTSTSALDERINKTVVQQIASLTKATVLDLAVAHSVSDQAVPFGSVTTAKAILIFSSANLSVKLNGAAAAIQFGTELVMYGNTAITSASLTNASGTVDATATVILVE